MIKALTTMPALALTRALSHAAGVESEPVRWREVGDSPWFDNQVATLEVDGRRLDFRLEKALPGRRRRLAPRVRAGDRIA